MKRQQTIEISGINIVTQPHDPQGYADIFQFIKDKGIHIAVSGDTHLKLIKIEPLDGKDLVNGVVGEILRFTHIGDQSSWVNINNGEQLDDEDKPNISPEKQPNGVHFDFVFYPKHEYNNNKHKLFFVSKYWDSYKKKSQTLSPNFVNRYFERLFSSVEFKEYFEFETAEVTVLPSNEALNHVLDLSTIRKLEIVVKTPNPDDIDLNETEFLEQMQKMNVAKKHTIYHSDGESIQPDDTIKKEAHIAEENGYVRTEGKDENGTNTIRSTTDIPLKESFKVDRALDAIKVVLRNFRHKS